MCDTILEKLKSLRSDLTSQIKKISDDFAILRSETNARLAEIESIMSKVDEIDNIKPKVQKLEDVGDARKSLSTLEETKKRLQEQTEALEKTLERMERHSRDFPTRVLGVVEEEGEDCLSIIQDFFAPLGLRDAGGEVENAHRTGKKPDGKPRHVIAKLYSRPFKRNLLQVAKRQESKDALNGDKFVEYFTPSDFQTRKKALQFMKQAFEDGKK